MTNTLPLRPRPVFYHLFSHPPLMGLSNWRFLVFMFLLFPSVAVAVPLFLCLKHSVWSRTWRMDEITKSFRNNILFEFHFIGPLPPKDCGNRQFHLPSFYTWEWWLRRPLGFIKIPYFLTFPFICETITFCINCLINEYGLSFLVELVRRHADR